MGSLFALLGYYHYLLRGGFGNACIGWSICEFSVHPAWVDPESGHVPTLYDTKPRFQSLLRPLSDALADRGVTPNHLTGSALILCFATGIALMAFPGNPVVLVMLAPVLLVRMALNALDGMIARNRGQITRFGALFNEIGDIAADGALYLPLAVALSPLGVSPVAVIAFGFCALLSEVAGILGPTIGASRRYDGPLGKSDRAAVVAIIAIWAAAGVGPTWVFTPVFWILAGLCTLTTLKRISAGLKEAETVSAMEK